MSDIMIKVENLGKCYQIDHEGQQGGYTALRDVIAQKAKGIFKKTPVKKSVEDFWAVNDISFEVKQGDAVGIIGRNGAGKSTLLKLLSRITEPTKGRITLNGRIASLLEVGTGFHPELTGRENIFLNGAILGMGRREIKQKFDQIVDFSGVEKFLDTPVKRYSSGMYVRLAFSVAAHLSSEILIVDEVLAVGDAEFQKKCLAKMSEIAGEEGRTLLFVSHSMAAIKNLCTKAIVLQKGMVQYQGGIEDGISAYQNLLTDSTNAAELVAAADNSTISISGFEIVDVQDYPNIIGFDQPMKFKITGRSSKPLKDVSIGIGVTNMDNVPLFTTRLVDTKDTINLDGDFFTEVSIKHNLRAGTYIVILGIVSRAENVYYNPTVAILEVSNINSVIDNYYRTTNYGLIDVESTWI